MSNFDFVQATDDGAVIQIHKPSATNSIAAQDTRLAKREYRIQRGRFTVHHPLGQVQESVMADMAVFYSDEGMINRLCSLINQNDTVSLRLLDWLVTSYARHKDFYIRPEQSVYESYKLALGRFRRRNFDPFRRSRRRQVGGTELTYNVTFETAHGTQRTTVGQLNFVCWTLRTGLYDYAVANKDEIDRCASHKRRRVSPPSASRRVLVCEGSALVHI